MNRYGNEIGVHTPERTWVNATDLKEALGIKLECSSWHNDLVDSVANDELNIQIFLPNSPIMDENNELFNMYSVVSADGEDNGLVTGMESTMYSFEDIVALIKSMQVSNEKRELMKKINEWVEPIISNSDVLTHHMLSAIKGKCDALILSDF
jgi:hypothetical protein